MSLFQLFVCIPLRVFYAIVRNLFYSWFQLRWTPSSRTWLLRLDKKIRATLKHENDAELVEVALGDRLHKIWTVKVKGDCKGAIPIVMLHGMGGGSDMFINNIDELAKERDLYLCDVPGFGLSSRPHMRTIEKNGWLEEMTEDDVEKLYTELFEHYFEKLGLDKFILLGHSYGGYLASVYCLTYPKRVKHLILADPWGFPQRPAEADQRPFMKNRYLRLFSKLYGKMNVFTPIRILGPAGPAVFHSLRADLGHKFHSHLQDHTLAPNYLYACNTVGAPTGEEGFFRVSIPFGWAKKPMVLRAVNWDPDLDVTFIYGARSWVDDSPGFEIKNHRFNSYVDVHVISGAGHHVYADRPVAFNGMVRLIGRAVDEGIKPNISHENEKRQLAMQSLRRRASCLSQAELCNDEAGIHQPRSYSTHELALRKDPNYESADSEDGAQGGAVIFTLDNMSGDDEEKNLSFEGGAVGGEDVKSKTKRKAVSKSVKFSSESYDVGKSAGDNDSVSDVDQSFDEEGYLVHNMPAKKYS